MTVDLDRMSMLEVILTESEICRNSLINTVFRVKNPFKNNKIILQKMSMSFPMIFVQFISSVNFPGYLQFC